jgi:SAM-dependent methyltransferase
MEIPDTAPSPWALGDYRRFARQTVWSVGPRLVAACGIGPGDRVLDVAAGTGNVAIRAAQAGARVVASDLTPEQLEAGRLEAAEHGVRLEWVEADAQALPFEDRSFDAVTSVFGAMMAPDHQAVADELVRVCRPGGTIGLVNFTPEGLGGAFFRLFGSAAPAPPPGAASPLLWGSEEHVRSLFGSRVEVLDLRRETYVEGHDDGPAGYCAFVDATFGPVVEVRAALAAADPDRLAALDREFLDLITRHDEGPPGGPAVLRYEYLLVVARVRRRDEP